MYYQPMESDDTTRQNEPEPRINVKRAARLLIAERGVSDVTVRQIAKAAGQKNMGAVAYYFGTKDKLIGEILIDGAVRIERRRQACLETLEANGGPMTIEEAVGAIILPSVEFSDQDQEYGEHFNRFLLQLSLSKPDFIDHTLEGRWNTGYQRCLQHLRRLMKGLTGAEQNRRFVFLAAYISMLLATRESMLEDPSKRHPTWRSAEMLNDIIGTAAAILAA